MSQSTFPTTVDVFEEMLDPTASDIEIIKRWQELQRKVSKTQDEISEYQNLTDSLSKKIFTAKQYNHLADSIVATQQFFKNNTVGHIETLKIQTEQIMKTYTDNFVHKGLYTPMTQYEVGNTVTHNGSAYQCVQRCIGVVPAIPSTYWSLMSAKGDKGDRGLKGDDGVGLVYKGNYDSLTSYTEAHLVSYGGQLYHNIKPCKGVIPTNSTYWEVTVERGASTAVDTIRYRIVPDSDTTTLVLEVPSYAPSTDVILAYKNGALLSSPVDYSLAVDGETGKPKVTLTTATNGTDAFEFIIQKNIFISTNYALSTISGITIPSANWSLNVSALLYETVVTHESFVGAIRIDCNFIDKVNLELAQSFKIQPYTTELPDGVKLYAKKVPTSDITASFSVWSASI